MNNKIDFEKLRGKIGITFEMENIDEIVTGEFVKKLRNDLKLTQLMLATILGVKKKTFEKWEQGKNPVKGTSSRLLYLFYKNPLLIQQIYKVTLPEISGTKYKIEQLNVINEAELPIVNCEIKNYSQNTWGINNQNFVERQLNDNFPQTA